MKPQKRNPAQISMTEEIIVDLFAGGGGASTGIETATGRVVSVAVNHSEDAIRLHHTNHPYTEYYREDVWTVNPVTVCNGRPVGLLWASPDCFVAGTMVLTAKGYVPIEEVHVGDLVLTHKKRWRPVVEVMQSVKPVYKVRGYGNPEMICSARHPFYTATKHGDPEPSFRMARTLRPGTDYWGVPVDMVSPVWNCPEERLDPNLAWIAGRYVGDGWLRNSNGHYETVITCGGQDIESLRSELENRACGFKWNFRRVRTGGQFTNCGKELCTWLLENFGKLSHNKTVPAWLFTASADFRKAFLDGYMSADGWRGGAV